MPCNLSFLSKVGWQAINWVALLLPIACYMQSGHVSSKTGYACVFLHFNLFPFCQMLQFDQWSLILINTAASHPHVSNTSLHFQILHFPLATTSNIAQHTEMRSLRVFVNNLLACPSSGVPTAFAGSCPLSAFPSNGTLPVQCLTWLISVSGLVSQSIKCGGASGSPITLSLPQGKWLSSLPSL